MNLMKGKLTDPCWKWDTALVLSGISLTMEPYRDRENCHSIQATDQHGTSTAQRAHADY